MSGHPRVGSEGLLVRVAAAAEVDDGVAVFRLSRCGHLTVLDLAAYDTIFYRALKSMPENGV